MGEGEHVNFYLHVDNKSQRVYQIIEFQDVKLSLTGKHGILNILVRNVW